MLSTTIFPTVAYSTVRLLSSHVFISPHIMRGCMLQDKIEPLCAWETVLTTSKIDFTAEVANWGHS